MKNIILGILGCMVAVYTIVSCLSIYSISTRKNEMENCISQVLKYHLNRYYATGVPDMEVEAYLSGRKSGSSYIRHQGFPLM